MTLGNPVLENKCSLRRHRLTWLELLCHKLGSIALKLEASVEESLKTKTEKDHLKLELEWLDRKSRDEVKRIISVHPINLLASHEIKHRLKVTYCALL